MNTKFTDIPTCTLRIPLAAYEYLIPNFSAYSWKKQGVHFYTNDLDTTDELDKYKLFQLNHYSYSNLTHPIIIPQILWEFLLNKSPLTRKGISLFYTFASPTYLHAKLPNMHKWERNLQREYPLHQWHIAIRYNSKSSSCMDHWDNAQKLLHRWYLTPSRLNKMKPSILALCWRECLSTGNLLHIFWSCKNIQPFWEEVQSLIYNVTNTHLKLEPALTLLSLGIEAPLMRKVVVHILFVARISIAKEWLSLAPPKIEEVISRVNAQ